MKNEFLERCRRCPFYDKDCGDVASCMKGFILYDNNGIVVIDCKLNKTESGTYALDDSDEE